MSCNLVKIFFIFPSMLLSVGCATYQLDVHQAKSFLKSHQPEKAAEQLRPLASESSDDQLVYLLDYATSLQLAEKYKESTKAFLAADQIADYKDYHSISKIAGSLVLNEGMVQYKGEDFEKVMINVMLAINFLMEKKYDSALVEAKKINQKLNYFIGEGKKKYALNELGFYLSAMVWEINKKWTDAYIDYKQAYDINPRIAGIGEDLIRTSALAQRWGDNKKWVRKFPEVKFKKEWKDRNYGELIVLYQQGWSPKKVARPDNYRFPMFTPVYAGTRQLSISIDGSNIKQRSRMVYHSGRAAIKALDEQYAALVAKRMAGVVVKNQIAQRLDKDNKGLGSLAWIIMNVADQADLRHWSTLPNSFQVSRVFLKAGKYKVNMEGLTEYGESGELFDAKEVQIKKGRKTFINVRSLN
ncbi:hypothetical protein N9W41_00025 [bacterium]|nr:hypothetical protein [bacterium]